MVHIDDDGFWIDERRRRRRRMAVAVAAVVGLVGAAAVVVTWSHRSAVEDEVALAASGSRFAKVRLDEARAHSVREAPATMSSLPSDDLAPDPSPGDPALPNASLAKRAERKKIAVSTGVLGAVAGTEGGFELVGDSVSGRGLGVRSRGGGGESFGFGSPEVDGHGSGSSGGLAARGSYGVSAGALGRAKGKSSVIVKGGSGATTASLGTAKGEAKSGGKARKGFAALSGPKVKGGGGRKVATPVPAPSFRPLEASALDDNVTFKAFTAFLAQWGDRASTAGYAHVHVADRRRVKVVAPSGRSVPSAQVRVTDGSEVVWQGLTYGDGRTSIYPVTSLGGRAGADLYVEATSGEATARARWTGKSLTLELDREPAAADFMPLDVAFVIDTTSSMSDEIARIKGTLLSVTRRVRALDQQVELRYGAVLYRDVGDEYVTRRYDFTADLADFDRTLQRIRANGGGDTPESLNRGLAEAVDKLSWRSNSAKVAFLIADAPPHMDYGEKKTYAFTMQAALSKGIRIHAVAASGLDQLGSLVFRQIAQFTRGKFIFIQYGSPAASAAKHGVASQVESNNLDAIIYGQIAREVEGWGR